MNWILDFMMSTSMSSRMTTQQEVIVNEEFISALEQIAEEKKISKESILEATESALAAAYRKDYAKPSQTIRCKIDPVIGTTEFWLEKKIVEEVADENSEILLADALKENKEAVIDVSHQGRSRLGGLDLTGKVLGCLVRKPGEIHRCFLLLMRPSRAACLW